MRIFLLRPARPGRPAWPLRGTIGRARALMSRWLGLGLAAALAAAGLPALAAALSGATVNQLRHWRSPRTGPLLVPEIATGPGVVYSFQDVLALRTFVRLRENASLQKIRAAIGNLLASPTLRDEFAPRAKARAAEFSVTATAERTAEVYEKLLRGQGSGIRNQESGNSER